jgi:NitT/TauT family transport system substrate-binding protein
MNTINIMALRHSAFYSPLLMTMAAGFLKEQGLQWTYAPATPEKSVPDSIRDGSCQVAQSAVATSFTDLEQGNDIDIVHFARINERDGFFLAGRHPEADFNWQSLKGKRVLVDHFFQPLAMFRYGLHQQGVTFDDIQAIDAGDPLQMEQRFLDGEGDYVHLQGPAPQQMQRDGVAYVVAAVGDAVGPVAFSSLCASREWLETAMAKSFMSAYRKAMQFCIEAQADEIAAYHHEAGFFPEIDRQVLSDTVSAYQSLGCWGLDPRISQDSYERLLDVFLFNRLISSRHDFHQVVVNPPF